MDITKLVYQQCPRCPSPVLWLDLIMFAKTIGTFSLAGAQIKVPAQTVPRLTCQACNWNLIGKIEDNQAVFDLS